MRTKLLFCPVDPPKLKLKSPGAGLLGVVLRPLRMPEQPKLEVPDNTFYFDPMTKRWRQHGVDDVDVSNIDPNTGRTIQQDHQMLGPPTP